MFLVDMTHARGSTSTGRRPRTAGRSARSGSTARASRDDAVLGQVGDGWRQLSGALLAERSGVAWLGWATRTLEALLDHCAGTSDPVLRDELAGLGDALVRGRGPGGARARPAGRRRRARSSRVR